VHSKIFPPRVITAATRRLKVSPGPLHEMSLPTVTACPPALAIGQLPGCLAFAHVAAGMGPPVIVASAIRPLPPAKASVPIHAHMTLDNARGHACAVRCALMQ